MPKQISRNDLDLIVKKGEHFPNGAGVEAIHAALEGKVPRRTLQRRLAFLVGQKRLIVQGRARASRYPLPIITAEAHLRQKPPKLAPRVGFHIPLSPEGEEIRNAVRKPVQSRRPVGYNRTFPDSYQPNSTYYLSTEIRQNLYELGLSPEEQHAAGTYARQIFNRLLIDLSWNSSRLEGNMFSLLETELLLADGEAAEGKSAMETQMIVNDKAAIELLVDQASEVGFNRFIVLNLHALLSDNLLADPQACGRLRTISVGISGRRTTLWKYRN